MCSLNDPPCLRSSNQPCPVPVGNTICGETNSLEIMKEFNRLYEEKLQQVDSEAGGDCLQEKLKLQHEWIRNLTQQNEMLVRAVQELEFEATERVQQLEEKLQKSAQCLCEGEIMLNEKERTVQELTQKINHMTSFGDVESMAHELKCKRQECDSLRQEMRDMRQALTEEVATKHDQVLMLKREAHTLEERCLQADKQTAFKEDIIKELRKEIKQLKQQVCIPEKPLKPSPHPPVPKHTQTTPQSSEAELPYLIINHTSKKQTGKNTVIYITKDGSVHKEVNFTSPKDGAKDHADLCSKCKNKLPSKKCFFPACKSENDLADVKNSLKPVKDRSKFTCTAFSRSKTFVDRTQGALNDLDEYMPVKMHVDYLENKRKIM